MHNVNYEQHFLKIFMTLYSENITMENPLIEIEYCTKCRWLARASWIAQELLSTFSHEISGITLIPSNIAGIFEIRCGRQVILSLIHI